MDSLAQLGLPAPDFILMDSGGAFFRLKDWRGKIVILHFWSAECPWVERADRILKDAVGGWGEQVVLCCIASNVCETAELVQETALERGLKPVLLDPGQRVADIYGAQTTPYIFIVDREGLLRYRGAVDDVTFRQREPTRFYLGEAVDALLQGGSPDPAETPGYGCAIVHEQS